MTALAPHHDGSPLYVSDQAPVLADRRPTGATLLDVGLAAIAVVWGELETHTRIVGSGQTPAAMEDEQ